VITGDRLFFRVLTGGSFVTLEGADVLAAFSNCWSDVLFAAGVSIAVLLEPFEHPFVPSRTAPDSTAIIAEPAIIAVLDLDRELVIFPWREPSVVDFSLCVSFAFKLSCVKFAMLVSRPGFPSQERQKHDDGRALAR